MSLRGPLDLSIARSEELKDDATGKAYTAYAVVCTSNGGANSFFVQTTPCTWTVMRRYSQFHDLRQKMEKEAVRPSALFPKKGFGSLSAISKRQRQEQLDAYIRELSESPLPEHLFNLLAEFVEFSKNAATTSAQGRRNRNGSAAGDRPWALPTQVETRVPAAMSAWDPSFMSADPLAMMRIEESHPVSLATAAASGREPPMSNTPHASAAQGAAEQADTVRSAAAPSPFSAIGVAPSFLAHSSSKTYPANGEGLRDAIKDKNVQGVKQVLAAAPETCNYEDRLSQSMLHLAALFDHTAIAVLLLEAGADASVTNHDKETPLDVAQPTLRRKMECLMQQKS